ncbi:unnamed protein product [Schistosoma mattheei]|uniref:Uncharacterized protein n=1 Tax=Schistosoma mattheei TaxID=31246 RepID=A0A183Q5M1_9TREM|nr:unnamed protein product [Schistosoma mattheei]
MLSIHRIVSQSCSIVITPSDHDTKCTSSTSLQTSEHHYPSLNNQSVNHKIELVRIYISIPNATTNAGEDDQCSSSSSRSQYTQRQKQDSPIQHSMQQSNQN